MYGKIAAYSAYDVFTLYYYLVVYFVAFLPRYLEWNFFVLIAQLDDHCFILPICLLLLRIYTGIMGFFL